MIAIADIGDPTVVALDAPRADFNAALIQLLVAVLQSVAAVDGPAAWRARLLAPLDQVELLKLFEPLEQAFHLDGDGARFMQDFELRESVGDPMPIASLLIETPGENTLKNNADLFIKRHRGARFCPRCAGHALLTLQINAPAGGAGHRTGLRGGGPLTTVLVPGAGSTLWQKVWLNVLPASIFHALNGELVHGQPHHRMPWLSAVGALQAQAGEVQPTQVHPLHVYWSMPRRIRLDFLNTIAGICDLCGTHDERCLTQYVTRNYGLNYKGPWRHPLSPYYKVKDEWLPVHPQPGGLGYRHWLGLTLGVDSATRRINAAPVVAHFLADQERRLVAADLPLRLWCFGHDMDNMKARCWYEATMPLYTLAACTSEQSAELRENVRDWISAADSVAEHLRNAVKNAFHADAGKDRKSIDLSHVDAAFWSATERRFHHLLRDAIAACRDGMMGDGVASRELWLEHLQVQAFRQFERDFIGIGIPEPHNMARVARARAALRRNLYGPSLRSTLGLPALLQESAAARPKRGKRSPIRAGNGEPGGHPA